MFDDKIQDMEPLFQNNFSVEPILILASMRSIFIQGNIKIVLRLIQTFHPCTCTFFDLIKYSTGRLELICTGSTCIYVNPDYEEMRRVRLR